MIQRLFSSLWVFSPFPVAALLLLQGGSAPAPSAENPAFEGRWTLLEEQSTPVDPRINVLEIDVAASEVTIKRRWSPKPTDVDSMTTTTDGTVNREPLNEWSANGYLAVAIHEEPVMRKVRASWLDHGRTLRVTSRFSVMTSQGKAPIRTYSEYRLSSGGERLTLLEFRSTRPKPLHYAFTRAVAEEATDA